MNRNHALTVYDLHAHFLVSGVAELVADAPGVLAERALQAQYMGSESIQYNVQIGPGWMAMMRDPRARIETMDRQGIDVQVISSSPGDYHYWADQALTTTIVETINSGIAEMIAAHPDRLLGLGMLSMQFPELAASQLERAVRDLGLRGAMISTHIAGLDLSEDRFEPVWAKAAEMGAAIFLHPSVCSLGERLARSYLSNIVGNPTETTVALSHLIFAGVLDRHPSLKICAAHGGGYLPVYRGRSDHAWRERPDSHSCQHEPSWYLRRMWFDHLVYEPHQLRDLIDAVGETQVVLGSDFPFDMGIANPVELLDAVPGLTDAERTAILNVNAERLLATR